MGCVRHRKVDANAQLSLQPKTQALVEATSFVADHFFGGGFNLSTTRPGVALCGLTGCCCGGGGGCGGGGVGVGRDDCEPILNVSFNPPLPPTLGREGISGRAMGCGGCHLGMAFDLTF